MKYDVCVVIQVDVPEGQPNTGATLTVADRLTDVVRHDREWSDILDAEGNPCVTGYSHIYTSVSDVQ